MQSPWEALILTEAQALVASAAPDDDAKEALDFVNSDLWRDGEGWIGQKPPPGEQYTAQMTAIANAFVAENATLEVVERHVAGVLGREPRWSFVPRRPLADGEAPTEAEAALIAEAEAALTEWWDRRKPLPTFRAALSTALAIDRAPLRLFVPSGFMGEGDTLAAADLTAALDLLYLRAEGPESCGVFVDDDTRAEAGVFAYQQYPPGKVSALPNRGDGTPTAALCFVGDDGATVLRVLGKDGPVEEGTPYPLGGRLLYHELRRTALITRQVRRGQKALNLALTQMVRNVNLAGSLERLFVNVMPPGRWVDGSGTPISAQAAATTSGAKFVGEPLPVGAGVSAFLRGQEVRDAEGKLTGYANGTVNYRDPVPVGTFKDSRDILYAGILGQCHQKHALISGDATASGESRKQARAEFEASLALSKAALDELGRWLLETALALAAFIAGQAGRYDDLRCEFGAIVDAGPQSAEDRKEYVAEWQVGAMSLETLLSLLEVEDVAAEIARIEAEKQAGNDAFMGLASGAQRGAVAPGGQQANPADVLASELSGAGAGAGPGSGATGRQGA